MLDLDRLALPLVVALSAIFIAWFAVGNEINRRRISHIMRWLWQGLQPYMGKASYRMLGTNAFHFNVLEARHPFSAIVVAVLLESRDMPTVWIMNRVRGRTDLALVKCELVRRPIWGMEAFRRGNVLTGEAITRARNEGWTVDHRPDEALWVAHGGGKAAELSEKLLDALGEFRPRLLRMSVMRQSPHLQVALSLVGYQALDARLVFATIERLAKVVGEYST